ncbi:hypothetical protein LTS08_003476 [Lithohypha guttulata]|nr:hypothetical protein LTS08_003476 [Lithohypha guttulata]
MDIQATALSGDDAGTQSASARNRPSYSCVRCSDRKVRCDRQRPCSACTKHKVECVYRPPQTSRNKVKRIKNDVLVERLKQYEALLKDKGIAPEASPIPSTTKQNVEAQLVDVASILESGGSTTLSITSSAAAEPSIRLNKTQLLQNQGNFKFVDNLWTRIVEEFPEPRDAMGDSWQEDTDEGESENELGFILGTTLRTSSRLSHPPMEAILQLWQVFIDNVDPLTKIVHVPSLQPAIQKAATGPSEMPRNFQALMFAIYSTAINSLKDDPCKQAFGQSRQTLLAHYISNTKIALARANFMSTTSLVVLQALALHIFSIRDTHEPRAVWSLTGIFLRLAEGMGLHRDGTFLGLPPFESEIRRRIWWNMKMHDYRTAELAGLTKFRRVDPGVDSPNFPTSLNDTDLFPGMTTAPSPPTGPTDMMFCAIRTEFAGFIAKHTAKFQNSQTNAWEDYWARHETSEKSSVLQEAQELMETKVLRYCDPSRPLHLMASVVGRSGLTLMHFLTHHPRNWPAGAAVPDAEKQNVWKISLQLLEQWNMAQSIPLLECFAWHAAYYLPWHALIYVLDSLRASPEIQDANKAWQIIDTIYRNNPDFVSNTKRPIYVAVGNLCLKAYKARHEILGSSNNIQPPAYILAFTQQRDAAKSRRQAKKEARNKKGAQQASLSHQIESTELSPHTSNSSQSNIKPYPNYDPMTPRPRPQAQAQPQHQPYSATIPPQPQAQLHSLPPNNNNIDLFWLNNEHNPISFTNNQTPTDMDMDTDFLLSENYGFDRADGMTIDWTQWDNFLGSKA